jgi:hypothetical protein
MAEVELEPAPAPTAGEPTTLLEESKGVPALLERVSALLRHRVVRVLAVVEALPQLCEARVRKLA